jgi:hypothetical protein
VPVKLLAVAVAVALALAVTGCSGGDDDDAAEEADTTTTTVVEPQVALRVTRAELVSPHAERGPLDGGTTDEVVDVVERLLLVTAARPLALGAAGGGFAALFTPDAGARAAGADRAAFFDEGVPSFGRLRRTTGTIEMTGLADFDGPAAALVVAQFDWSAASRERPGDRVERRGELSLVRQGGNWRIGAYTIAVTRTIGATTTTTTAASE